MKQLLFAILAALLISSCDVWSTAPQPIVTLPSVPSSTPAVVTATPIILPPPNIETNTPGGDSIITSTPFPADSETPPPSLTPSPDQPTSTFTQPIVQSVGVDILGCNTSIDILHSMGEVTNAYITVKNTGTVDLPNTCALLRAIDEGRPHPDKQVCVDNLPAQYQVSLKLTVDSTYKQETMIQVDVTSNENILLRVDRQSCRDIGLFGGAPADINLIKPIP